MPEFPYYAIRKAHDMLRRDQSVRSAHPDDYGS